jgi:protein phosphatase
MLCYHTWLKKIGSKKPHSISCAYTQICGDRHYQEDAGGAFCTSHSRQLMVALADGMGGLSHGNLASKTAITSLLETYAHINSQLPIVAALTHAIQAANQSVYQLALNTAGAGQVGTTLVTALISDHKLYWASVGDSRLYFYRAQDQSLTVCTEDHTLANQLRPRIWQNRLSHQLIDQHPNRDCLTSFLGLARIPRIDRNYRPLQLCSGDRLLLCSDGVTQGLTTKQLQQLIKRSASASSLAHKIMETIIAKHCTHQDNATVLILTISASTLPRMISTH